jgi:hypothetical protein
MALNSETISYMKDAYNKGVSVDEALAEKFHNLDKADAIGDSETYNKEKIKIFNVLSHL